MKVEIIEFATLKVAYVRHIVPYNECGQAWEKLCTWAGPNGLIRPGCKFLGLCYDDPEVTPPEKIRYDACITIDSDITPEGDIGIQTIDSGTYAMTTHFGPYENLTNTYSSFVAAGRRITATKSLLSPVSKYIRIARKIPPRKI